MLSRWYILSTTWYSTPYLKGMVVEVADGKRERERKSGWIILSKGTSIYTSKIV